MKKRHAVFKRTSQETDIDIDLALEGHGDYKIETTIPFFDHMLTAFSRHGFFDIKLKAHGDTDVDDHHLVEDVGICLGKVFHEALGDYKGIERYGHFSLVMEEACVDVACDLSQRVYFVYDVLCEDKHIKNFQLDLLEEFWRAFAINLGLNIHIHVKRGRNAHHIHEAIFKSVARALRMAVRRTHESIPSTKGLLG